MCGDSRQAEQACCALMVRGFDPIFWEWVRTQFRVNFFMFGAIVFYFCAHSVCVFLHAECVFRVCRVCQLGARVSGA